MKYYLYCDGASRGNPGPASYGFVVEDGEGGEVADGCDVIGRDTNNVAEYRGLIAGLECARDLGITDLEVRLDSLLLVRQVNGDFKVRAPGLKPLHRRAVGLLSGFESIDVTHIPRERNTRADALANQALDGERP